MKNLVFACLLVLSLFALTVAAGEMTGVISESKCGAKHADGGEKAQKCVAACIKNGAAPVFVNSADKSVLKIANPEKTEGHYGHKVKVDGNVDGDTLTIQTIEMAH